MSEEFLCLRRKESFLGVTFYPRTDHWDSKPNGDRTCSYCGSMHPDDFMGQVAEAAKEGSVVSIEPSDKDYKVYVHRPSVTNASEGGIKFYKQHLPEVVSEEQRKLFKLAIQMSHKRFEEKNLQRA